MKKIKYLIVVFCCFCMLNLLAGCKNETNSQQSGSVNNSINNSGNEPAPTHTAVTPGNTETSNNTVTPGNTETSDNTVTPTVSEAPTNNSDDEDKDRNTKADADDTEKSREEAGEETKEEVKEETKEEIKEEAKEETKKETKKTDENDVAECPYPMDVLPVVTIDTGRKSISESKEYTPVVMSFYSPDGSYIKIEQNSGIRTRGNFSKGLAKKSYKFKLEEKKNLYGLSNGKEKIWVLIANHCDQSLLRNQLAFDLQRSLSGVAWQPNCTSVELYINGKYEGVYLLAEEIKVSKDRVNIAKDNVDDTDTGYLVQFTTYAGGDNGKECFNVQGASYEITSDLSENRQIRRNQVSYIENYIKKCFDALNKGNKEEAEKLMDLDSLVACYITEEVSKNIDSSWDSFYMYKDAGGKLVFGPVWDFDLAFGNDWRISDNFIQSYQDLYVACGDGSVNGDNRKTWYVIANNNAWFRQMVVDAWVKDYDNIKAVGERNNTRATDGEVAFKRNFTRWKIFGQRINQEPSYVRSLRSFESHAQLLNEWYVKRVEWLDDKFRNGDYVEKGAGTEKGSSGWNEYNDPNYENEGGEQFPSEHNNWSYETESSTALLEKYEDVSSLVLIDSIEAPKGFGGEGSANLFDKSSNKYCVNCGDGKYPVIFEMKEAVEIKAYVLYTANDTKFISNRNPKSWTVYGSNDGKNWTEIAKENKGREALDATNFTGYGFEISSPGPYKYYYFYFINDETIQFSELTLLR